jgi:sugar phosphate isomerase/epimerase
VIPLGIFAKTFAGDRPTDVLASVRDAGYRVTQFNMACSGLPSLPSEIPAATALEVGIAARNAGVEIAAVSATYNMIHPDPGVRQRGLGSLAAIAGAAGSMGTRLLTLCTGTRDPDDQWRGHPDNGSPGAWRDLLASMEAALLIAEAHDLELGIEPERANVVDSAQRAERLLRELGSSRVKIVLDPANLVEAETQDEQRRIVASAIERLAGALAICHAKDRTSSGAFVAAGAGVLDYPHYLRCLQSAGFNGPLIAHGLTEAEAPEVARFLGRAKAEAGVP